MLIMQPENTRPDDTKTEDKWSFHSEDQPDQQAHEGLSKKQSPISWTASEFIAHHKDASWYLTLIAGTLMLSGLVFITTRDIISVFFIIVVSILFAVLANKKPRQLTYTVDGQGITVGDKFHPYSMFKSFAVLREGAFGFINLMPLKRFMPEVSIYFALNDEEKIVEALSKNLPYEHREEHGIDRLVKRMRF